MPKFSAPLPHDTESDEKAFKTAFSCAMRKTCPISSPAQKPASVSGDSGAGLVKAPTLQSFESWVQTLGDLYRTNSGRVSFVECSEHVQQILIARALLDEYRAFAAVCND